MSPESWSVVQGVSAVVGAVGAMVGGAASLVALSQIRLFRKQMAHDHERSRRDHAINDLSKWNAHLSETVTSARRLVETFSGDQLECLKRGRGFNIPVKHKAMAVVALAADVSQVITSELMTPLLQDDEHVVLSAEHAIRLRNRCIEHLNACEISLLGWRHGAADRQIIEEQMNYLVDLRNGWRMLEDFRTIVVGEGAYPSVAQFVQVIYQRKRDVHDQAVALINRVADPKRPLASD